MLRIIGQHHKIIHNIDGKRLIKKIKNEIAIYEVELSILQNNEVWKTLGRFAITIEKNLEKLSFYLRFHNLCVCD